tara:strand:- start:260 stop:535 length:276 start_codon:yes stop_codon:yes gene_type:complete
MPRYSKTDKRKNYDIKKRYLTTTIYNTVPKKDDDMYFIAQEGDRCDNLAYQFYEDPSLWWFIARVNNLKSNNIPAGTSLRIPVTTREAEGH